MHVKKLLLSFALVIMMFAMVDGRNSKVNKNNKKRNRKYSGKCKPQIMAEYELAFQGGWSEQDYPRMFPKYRPTAQWSKLIGRSHSDKYLMWQEGAMASGPVKQFAEDGDTAGFDVEAQGYGGIRDLFTAAPIRGGLGKSATNFLADGSHSKLSFMVKLTPSPDWFVGVSSFNLCEKRKWKSHIKIDLYPMDAGTDRGLTFTSPDWPSNPRETIYTLSPNKPAHSASSFFYKNMTSLPPIAKVYLTKVSEYRRRGKEPSPLKQERNLIIYHDTDAMTNSGDVLPKLEKAIDKALDQRKEQSVNEIDQPRAERLTAHDPGCIVSEWSAWTPCSTTCGFGRQEHHRTIVRRSVVPGLYCPVLREDRTCGGTRTCEWNHFRFLNAEG